MHSIEVAPGVYRVPFNFSNVYFAGSPGAPWAVIDSGVPGKAQAIRQAASLRYGPDSRPAAIILTHGHMDHAGSAHELAHSWKTPIFAHPLETPYLTGKSPYPPKDPTVPGAMAFITRFLDTKPFDLRPHLQELPSSGDVPAMPGWKWIHTPGHAPGHVSLWHATSRVLIAGDAFLTVDVDSPIALLTKEAAINKPPAPFTYDWDQAHESVRSLAALHPSTVACGHGVPMSGSTIALDLQHLADHFDRPAHGRYIPVPAQTGEQGVRFVPPAPPDPLPKIAATAAVMIAAAAALSLTLRRQRSGIVR